MSDGFEYAKVFFSGESPWRWAIAIAGTAIFTLIFKVFLRILAVRLRKITSRTKSVWDDVGVDFVDGLKTGVIFIWTFHLLSKSLRPPESIQKLLLILVVLFSVIQVSLWGLHLIRTWQQTFLQKRVEENPSSAAALGLLYTGAQATFLVILALIGLSNLGIDITALLTGLGVGGIAVALAAQNVLGDLLASLSIVLDKPFVVGDFIVAGTESGTIEHIGIKTTRLRSLSGEQVVLSNKDLLESRVHNYKRMSRRRVVQSFGVTYSTPAEILEKIPQWARELTEAHDSILFDRCHFMKYGASSLDFEFVFYVLDPEYNTFMDIQQTLLLGIFKKFSKEKVEFAFPTTSVYVEKFPRPEIKDN
jgi:small-conductance mechanosensitive channel